MVRKRKGKSAQREPQPSDFLMGETSNIMGMIRGQTTLPGQKKATVGDILAYVDNFLLL